MNLIQVLVSLEIIVALALIFVVLIQNKSVSLNLSSMSGGMNEVTRRGPEKVLHNMTVVLGLIFICNSIALFLLK